MRFPLVVFFLIIFQITVAQVNEFHKDSIVKFIPGQYGVKYPHIKMLSSPHISPFMGVRKIIPGKSQLIGEKGIIKTQLPHKQHVINSPLVNSGIKSTEIPTKYILNYVSESFDTSKIQYGTVKKLKIKIPKSIESGKPLYKEEATINLKYFDIAQGLFSSYIMALETDDLGTIWMGTNGAGVIAYDGKFFRQYSTDQGLPSNDILELFIDSKNRIWIGTFDNGLICYNGAEFHHYTTETGLPGNKIRSIVEDKEGRIWIGSDDGLSAIYNNTLEVYGLKQGLDVRQIYDIAIGQNNELWIGTFNMGVIMFDGISFFQYGIVNGLPTSAIWALNIDQYDNVWMGTFGEGIIKFDGKYFYQYALDQGIESTEIFSVNIDADHNLWFGTDGGGIIKYNGTSFSQITTKHGLTNDIVWDIIDDPSGNYWIASFGGGLMKYDGGLLQYLSKDQGLTDNIALSFAEDEKQNMWIGSWGNGLMKYDGNNVYSWDNSNGISNNTIWDLTFYNGALWFATEGGGVSKIKDNLVVTYNSENGLFHDEVNTLFSNGKGLWVGTYGGLNLIHHDTVFQFGEKQGLLLNEIISLQEDRYGSLWIGSKNSGLAVFVNDKFIHLNLDQGLSSNTIYDIFEDKTGNIWLATNDKINIIPSGIVKNIFKVLAHQDYIELSRDLCKHLKDNIKIIGKEHGLNSNQILNFASVNGKDIWVGTKHGVSKFSLYQHQDFNIPTINVFGINYYVDNYGYQQGFIGGDIFANNSMEVDHFGNIWLGTGKLITRLDGSKEFHDTLKPGIQITSVDLFYESVNWFGNNDNSPARQIASKMSFGKEPMIQFEGVTPWSYLPQNLELSHEVNHITFNFNGLDWLNPENLKYQFVLDGYEEFWNPLTDQYKNTYSNLEPGHYVFRVRAFNAKGLSSDEAKFEFSILPPWWKTLWFRILAVVIGLLVLYIGYQWRIRSYKYRQKELEKIVNERTSEVTEKNEELLQQTEEILAQRNEIESKKNQLEIVHKDLMESIEYAHFIQKSMMPMGKINELQDQFIFFRPKERISGDFYWWTKVDNKLIATVADCTGHGVPGALMSMLGISFLREIVVKDKCYRPADILNNLRQEVIAVLDQKMEKGVQKDGMDMALIAIDMNNLSASFAGARNTLVLIRDGDLVEYNSDKAPISIYLKMKEFEQKEMQFKPGDQIYLFTDGYPDQFNGENGKKFKRARFKDLLLSISAKPMEEQKDDLITHFEKWKGTEEQIDDVTIVGFKL